MRTNSDDEAVRVPTVAILSASGLVWGLCTVALFVAWLLQWDTALGLVEWWVPVAFFFVFPVALVGALLVILLSLLLCALPFVMLWAWWGSRSNRR